MSATVRATGRIDNTAVAAQDWSIFDEPEFADYCFTSGSEISVALAVSGMHCASCAWRIEQCLAALDGVTGFEVNLTAARVDVRWQAERATLSAVLGAIAALGFEPRPIDRDHARELERRTARGLLMRFAVAVVFGMQVMMLALATYLDIEAEFGAGLARFFSVTALVMTLPIVGYSAQPFFRSAWRALAARSVNMDVPIALAIGLAFTGSCINTARGLEPIYFDSVAMFVLFLLGSRYLEMRARVAAASGLDALATLLPECSTRIADATDGGEVLEVVPSARLSAGDRIRVRADEVIPADGVVVSGQSMVDESVLSGESEPLERTVGAEVSAGSVNLEAPLDIRVTAVGEASFVGHLQRLVRRAAAARLAVDEFGTRVAGWFVAGVLLTASLTAFAWWMVDASRAFAATLAVLVAACPCALALARPAALSAAHAGLLRRGIAVIGQHGLERLTAIDSAWFDKTGTLTAGHLDVVHFDRFNAAHRGEVLALVRALSEASRHPLSSALCDYATGAESVRLEQVTVRRGYGVQARYAGVAVMLGSRRLLEEADCRDFPLASTFADDGGKEVWLALDGAVMARFELSDPPRPGTSDLLRALKLRGLGTAIVSGDRRSAVSQLADTLGVKNWFAGCSPEEKLSRLEAARNEGQRILMVGDGANDSPVLAQADVAIAVGNATPIAAQQADVLLMTDELDGVITVLDCARRLRRIVRQNMTWAIVYNLGAVPLAALGLLPPWAAAIGMSASSLLVVMNALCVRRGLD